MQEPICKDSRKCFAKSRQNRCRILSKTDYANKDCPFCKENYDGSDEGIKKR